MRHKIRGFLEILSMLDGNLSYAAVSSLAQQAAALLNEFGQDENKASTKLHENQLVFQKIHDDLSKLQEEAAERMAAAKLSGTAHYYDVAREVEAELRGLLSGLEFMLQACIQGEAIPNPLEAENKELKETVEELRWRIASDLVVLPWCDCADGVPMLPNPKQGHIYCPRCGKTLPDYMELHKEHGAILEINRNLQEKIKELTNQRGENLLKIQNLETDLELKQKKVDEQHGRIVALEDERTDNVRIIQELRSEREEMANTAEDKNLIIHNTEADLGNANSKIHELTTEYNELAKGVREMFQRIGFKFAEGLDPLVGDNLSLLADMAAFTNDYLGVGALWSPTANKDELQSMTTAALFGIQAELQEVLLQRNTTTAPLNIYLMLNNKTKLVVEHRKDPGTDVLRLYTSNWPSVTNVNGGFQDYWDLKQQLKVESYIQDHKLRRGFYADCMKYAEIPATADISSRLAAMVAMLVNCNKLFTNGAK
jgi:hypothetical protein